MKVTLRLGEPFWRTINAREVALDLPEGATTADALAALIGMHPLLRGDMSGTEARPAVFVDDMEVEESSALHDGAVVHVVWPISGGSGRRTDCLRRSGKGVPPARAVPVTLK